ncbi:Zinc finger CCCH domain-containing protein 62 [Acorus calamus]|uniref:Zinc finger CCCH domain-containing protein 62 n=1 Tax=Acorus calamus TaxID=4465 RepID=A0AAV9E6V6_ACOCL|nr:Zinc finger CCCH domain-containing protein 62 [Acorus calamus]
MDLEIPELNQKEKKCFEKVEMIIRGGFGSSFVSPLDGQLEKLKVDECKVYLRKYGLRLIGNKDVLIARIREHLEVMDGGGEKRYPISSFVFDCKGDACTGDVVMFEQNVYDMYSIASRSATGPPCGTRTVVGRIVKESYGAEKQQHTFTIEVLWSKGKKPLPPMHPLLIKGRNLYRIKTMRQKWDDEVERKKTLQEKHSRGFVARCSREKRIETRGSEPARSNRFKRPHTKQNSEPNRSYQTQQSCSSVPPVPNNNSPTQANRPFWSGKPSTKQYK